MSKKSPQHDPKCTSLTATYDEQPLCDCGLDEMEHYLKKTDADSVKIKEYCSAILKLLGGS